MQLVVVLNIMSPMAGEMMAFRCAVDILVIRVPWVFELISSFAEGSGFCVPIPTP